MCGIAGVYHLDGACVEPAALGAMTSALRHRGPDGTGTWLSPNGSLGLGHTRLAILDLSENGAQPMHYRGRYSVTYNGEIYNYLELREQLVARGHAFSSTSDTEVLLAAYAEYGAAMLDKLDGMFAFAIWDQVEQTLFCARDRFGEKPFFYHWTERKTFAFASEIKGLFAAGVSAAVDYAMLFNYLAYDVVENPVDKTQTFFAGVRRLEAGHCLLIHASGQVAKRRYWNVPAAGKRPVLPFEDAVNRFRELFDESVARRLRADVKVGTSLSGGLDSSSVVTTVARALGGTNRPSTFSARFDDPALDEGQYIDLVVQATGAEPHTTWPDTNTLLDDLDRIYYHQEEPFGSASIVAQWQVMKLARQAGVLVLLDGQGADELLAGYLHYFRTRFQELYSTDRARFRTEVQAFEKVHKATYPLTARFRVEATIPRLLDAVRRVRRRVFPLAGLKHLHPEFAAAYRQPPPPFGVQRDLNGTLRYSTLVYGLEKLLRFSDRNSMAFGVEVRLPFLSHHLAEFVLPLPASYKLSEGWTKRILRQALEPRLPPEICWRTDKLGFMPPQEKWLQHPQVQSRLAESRQNLTDAKLLTREAAPDPWQCLMTSGLLTFTKTANDNAIESRQAVRPIFGTLRKQT